MLSLEAWVYEQLFEFTYNQLFVSNDWVFLKYLDLAKILLLGLEGMGGRICYDSMTLGLIKERNLVLEST